MTTYKHHLYGTRIYEIWRGMKKRCYLKTHIHYKNYGGRGITVCGEWKDSVKSFYDWAMENGYRDDLTIDRIDNNKGYCPENCRWVTFREQAKNTTKNHNITYKGETHTLTDWGRIVGIDARTLCERLKRGWSVDQALFVPKGYKVKTEPHYFGKLCEFNGIKKTYFQWSKELNIPESTLRYRDSVGKPLTRVPCNICKNGGV